MAKCLKCNRELPLSGKCPICDRAPAPPGFSFNRLLQKDPEVKTATPPVSFQPPPPLKAEPPQPSNRVLDSSHLPPPPTAAPPRPSILASLKAKTELGQQEQPILPQMKHTEEEMSKKASSPLSGTPRPPIDHSLARQAQVTTTPEVSNDDSDNQNKVEASVFSSKATGHGDEEMECAVLVGILTDNYLLENATSKGLVIDLFSTRYSRALCRAIMTLREENREGSLIDKIIIKNKLKQLGLFDGPMQNFLNRVLAQPVPTMDQVLHYLELLKDQALKRKLKEISERITDFIDHPDPEKPVTIEAFSGSVINEMRNIQKARTTKRINLVKEEMREIVKDIEDREVNGEVEIIGYSFEPFHFLNVALSGFRKGFMYAIAGAPRRGKTTFTLELATCTATNCRIPVLFFTYEQTKKNLTYRLLAKESRLNPDSLQRKKIRSDFIMDGKFMSGWKKMQSYMDYFYIVEATKVDTIDRIRSYAYNVMQDFNTEDLMIFVDYIQKMPLSRNYMDEKFKVEEISTELKALSIELNNPIMTISSLSKEGCQIDATDDAERPTMYHCKGSGDLEYDLDCAMIQAKDWGDTKEIYQQLQHKAEEMGKDPTRVPKIEVVNLYLDKNRDAPEGIYSTMQYLFFVEDNKFVELGPKYEDDQFRFSKVEALVSDLIAKNYIVFYDRDKSQTYQKGRVQIKLKDV